MQNKMIEIDLISVGFRAALMRTMSHLFHRDNFDHLNLIEEDPGLFKVQPNGEISHKDDQI